MSFSASGQIAQALVFLRWKSLKTVREYVIPRNPNTPLQQVQRGYFADAVEEWHLTKYSASDRSAWDRYAAILEDPMSGFNAFVQQWLNLARAAADVLNPPWLCGLNPSGAGEFDADLEEDGDAASAFLFWGYSPTNMPTLETLAEAPANVWTLHDIAATSGLRIYGRYVTNGVAYQGYSGIYQYDVP